MKIVKEILMSAVMRVNPALPPHWSLVRAACEIVASGWGVRGCALHAIDEKTGRGHKARKALCREVVTHYEAATAYDYGRPEAILVKAAWPEVWRAIDSGVMTQEAMEQTTPDIGEIYYVGSGVPTRTPEELMTFFWPSRDGQRSVYATPQRPNHVDQSEWGRHLAALCRLNGDEAMAQAVDCTSRT